MDAAQLEALLEGISLIQRELLLFAGVWFLIGFADELAVDLVWIIAKLRGRFVVAPAPYATQKARRIAVFIPAWREAAVIGFTLSRALAAWPAASLRIYLGCYRNDPSTMAAAMAAAGDDSRLRIVVLDREGPSSKADCLNRLWQAMAHDEARDDRLFEAVLLHDAEDVVHPEALQALSVALAGSDFIQLPVEPLLDPESRWIAAHYADEFAEAHGKTMPVRELLGAPLPAAGVGCCFARSLLERIAARRRSEGLTGPFAADCLTEDYELGLLADAEGGRSRFLRVAATDGSLIATRALFPSSIAASVAQKTRWMHGIALQGWDRMGWTASARDIWMRLRDRRGPLAALVLTCAYFGLLLWGLLLVASLFGSYQPEPLPPLLAGLLTANLAGFLWRAAFRFHFTARLHGPREGLQALARIPVANIIAIMSGWRALWRYALTLLGAQPRWDKTAHRWPVIRMTPA